MPEWIDVDVKSLPDPWKDGGVLAIDAEGDVLIGVLLIAGSDNDWVSNSEENGLGVYCYDDASGNYLGNVVKYIPLDSFKIRERLDRGDL
jgi:hypothetical protein